MPRKTLQLFPSLILHPCYMQLCVRQRLPRCSCKKPPSASPRFQTPLSAVLSLFCITLKLFSGGRHLRTRLRSEKWFSFPLPVSGF